MSDECKRDCPAGKQPKPRAPLYLLYDVTVFGGPQLADTVEKVGFL
jgi:hypothetical protein